MPSAATIYVSIGLVVRMSAWTMRLVKMRLSCAASSHVLGWSNGFQMIRVDALSVFAEMIDMQSVSNWPLGGNKGDAMR